LKKFFLDVIIGKFFSGFFRQLRNRFTIKNMIGVRRNASASISVQPAWILRLLPTLYRCNTTNGALRTGHLPETMSGALRICYPETVGDPSDVLKVFCSGGNHFMNGREKNWLKNVFFSKNDFNELKENPDRNREEPCPSYPKLKHCADSCERRLKAGKYQPVRFMIKN